MSNICGRGNHASSSDVSKNKLGKNYHGKRPTQGYHQTKQKVGRVVENDLRKQS